MVKKSTKNKKGVKRITKRQIWLAHYLNNDNPSTFLNGGASVRAAGYKCNNPDNEYNVASQNYRLLQKKIELWLDEKGLSEGKLKEKLLYLLNAKETKFFQAEGKVTDTREVEALEVQRRALDMALKVKGLYAPERHTLEVDLIPMTPAESLAYRDAAGKIAQAQVQQAISAPDKEDKEDTDEADK